MEEQNEQTRKMLQQQDGALDGKASKTSKASGKKREAKLDEEALRKIDAEVMKRLEMGEDP